MPNSSEKYELEIAALNQFADALAGLWGARHFAFRELRAPPEPDALCTLHGQALHVEVGHFYGTQSDAKQLLGRQGKSAATALELHQAAQVPLDVRLLTPLNRLLADKATKTYHSARVWLLVRCAFPHWRLEDFRAHRDAIAVPAAHPYEQIWLLCGPHAASGLMRLA